MKIAIIGAGNMGGAIAVALARGKDVEVIVSNPHEDKLLHLKELCKSITTTTSNVEAVKGADIIMLAVKPWLLSSVINEISGHIDSEKCIKIVSVAGGVNLSALVSLLPPSLRSLPIFYVIPDTAISVGHGMTFISSTNASSQDIDLLRSLFALMGDAVVIEERLMSAATALSSCGIAYVYKFVQAMVQAGVELGFRPADALRYVLATAEGAVAMLQASGSLPQAEIDKVTTPGGMTIRGINALEHNGFSSAVIKAVLTPLTPK